MKFVNLRRVLVISPHPDDAEYSVSGTVDKYQDTTFYLLTLSPGGNFDDSTGANRLLESRNFWNNFKNVIVLDPVSPSKSLADVTQDALINTIDKHSRLLQFDGIMCPPNLDSHFEHRMAHEIARAVCRFGARSLIEYNTPSTYSEWGANVFVDINDFLGTKMDMLKQHFVSQLDRLYFEDDIIEDFHSDFFCSKRGLGRVEKFKVDFLMA